MISGSALQAKVKTALGRLTATPKVIKFREVTFSGGNSRLGIGQTETVTDTAIDPQPAVEYWPWHDTMLTQDEAATSAGFYQPGDYRFTFDGSISENLFRTRLLLYGDEVLQITRMEPIAFDGVIAAWAVVARTIKPGE